MSNPPAQPDLLWRKSNGSGDGNCVEVAALPDGVAVRDSKDPSGPMLQFDRTAWASFIDGIRSGDFEGTL